VSKVLLIYPEFLLKDGPAFNIPIGLLQLGSYIESKGVNIDFVDCNVEDEYMDTIYRKLDGSICVGISAMTAHLPSAMKISKEIRGKMGYKNPIVLGGVHATLFPQQTVLDNLIDFVVVGEGELSFLELLEHMEGKRDILNVQGVAFLDKNGVPQVTHRHTRFDFNEMPNINYKLLNKKVLEQFGDNNYISALTSRGCPHRCAFCINVAVKENQKWRAWPPKRMADEVEHILKFGANKICFWDENFFVSKKRVEEFLDEIERRNIEFQWVAEVRADYFRKFVSDKLLIRLKKHGCRKLAMGAESGSPKMLDIYCKDIEVNDIHFAAQKCVSHQIQPNLSFMIGAPGEDKNDIGLTLLAIKKLYDISDNVRILGPQLFRPYPGSSLYKECKESGWKEPSSLKEWADRMLSDFKESDAFSSPWIGNPDMVNTVWFYSLFLCVDFKKLIKMFMEYCDIYRKSFLFKIIGSIGVVAIIFMGRLRYKLNFHKFQYEIKLLKKYRFVLSF
jgi:radical SAM superfamily enzyme YgiQ (UPF0313 family)